MEIKKLNLNMFDIIFWIVLIIVWIVAIVWLR